MENLVLKRYLHKLDGMANLLLSQIKYCKDCEPKPPTRIKVTYENLIPINK